METIHDISDLQLRLFTQLEKGTEEYQLNLDKLKAGWNAVSNNIASGSQNDADATDKWIDECISVLVAKGWFISSWHTPIAALVQLGRWMDNGECQKCDEWLADHFTEILPIIEKQFESNFPVRYTILKDAFDAHKQEKYNLSVPVILAQADGVGLDVFGVSPYSRKKDNIGHLLGWLENNMLFKEIPYFWAIAESLPINQRIKIEDVSSNPLNRHAVLHGLSTDYGTRINSSKALSWLLFVADFSPLQKRPGHT